MMHIDFPTYWFNAATGELQAYGNSPHLDPTDIGYVGTGHSMHGRGSGEFSRLDPFSALPYAQGELLLQTVNDTGRVIVDRKGQVLSLGPGEAWTDTETNESAEEPGCVVTDTRRITNFAFQDRRKITYYVFEGE